MVGFQIASDSIQTQLLFRAHHQRILDYCRLFADAGQRTSTGTRPALSLLLSLFQIAHCFNRWPTSRQDITPPDAPRLAITEAPLWV